jgi:hypothetical protein
MEEKKKIKKEQNKEEKTLKYIFYPPLAKGYYQRIDIKGG